MRPICAGACLLLMLGAGCASSVPAHDPWFGQDKAYHFAGAAVIGATTTFAAHEGHLSDGQTIALAIPVTLAIGAGKEAYDRNVKGTFWSWRDMAWNAAGAVVGSMLALQAN